MPLPIVLPLIAAGKAAAAAGIALYGHRAVRLLQRPIHYAALTPVFDPATMLDGRWNFEGLAHGPRGRVIARLTGDLEGSWQGDAGTLRVRFHTDQGEAWEHTLDVHREGPDGLRIEAAALPRKGEGKMAGNSVRLRYLVTLPASMGGWVLDAEDWIHALPNGSLAYQGQYHKVGLPVGSTSFLFSRPL